jgi:hypothetical protein
MQFIKYNEIVKPVYASGFVQIPDRCNGYLAVNEGDALIWINDFPLHPNPNWATNKLAGESTGLQGNIGEIYTGYNGSIKVVVDTTVGTHPQVVIVFKYYICD